MNLWKIQIWKETNYYKISKYNFLKIYRNCYNFDSNIY